MWLLVRCGMVIHLLWVILKCLEVGATLWKMRKIVESKNVRVDELSKKNNESKKNEVVDYKGIGYVQPVEKFVEYVDRQDNEDEQVEAEEKAPRTKILLPNYVDLNHSIDKIIWVRSFGVLTRRKEI